MTPLPISQLRVHSCMAPTNGANRRTRVLILGAAGRDYHTFNTKYRVDPYVEVVGFTHAQARTHFLHA